MRSNYWQVLLEGGVVPPMHLGWCEWRSYPVPRFYAVGLLRASSESFHLKFGCMLVGNTLIRSIHIYRLQKQNNTYLLYSYTGYCLGI